VAADMQALIPERHAERPGISTSSAG